MTTYKIYDKEYELRMKDESRTIWPKLSVTLVSDDGDEIKVFYHDCDQYDGEPEAAYAGGGMFYDLCAYDGKTVTPDKNAQKLTPDEWVEFAAGEMAFNMVSDCCEFPLFTDCPKVAALRQEVCEWLEHKYECLFGMFIDSWVENRLAEETVESQNQN